MKFIKIKGKIKQRLKLVLPLTALALLAVIGIIGQSKVKKENNLPIIVFDMDTVGNLKKVMQGEEIGTLVHK